MTINVITLFEIEIGGPLQKRSLDKTYLTALSIWLVEGINNPDVPPLSFLTNPFIWRVNPEKGDPYFKVSGCDTGMNFLEARQLMEDIGKLASDYLLMDDTYPDWYDHPKNNMPGDDGRYKVRALEDGLLTYIDGHRDMPILPIALKLDKESASYKFIVGSKESGSSPYYKFG
ncbi:hypothetical protein AH04_192 [Erwinia phage AH04]|uniref:Uncharacterized protein n=1 Tax=Erwinia phage AH04 TaxID=2869569 RepID=A0AAE8BUS7_9CAUD|nr:hypothetical protein PQC02_gp122 [Erwinia phage AH04]QZA70667.1 hypothetical protein AH04_192 [Erwinia phage AH04]